MINGLLMINRSLLIYKLFEPACSFFILWILELMRAISFYYIQFGFFGYSTDFFMLFFTL